MFSRLFCLLALTLSSAAALAETLYYVAPDAEVPVTVRDTSEKSLPAGAADLSFTENGLTFNVFLLDVRNNTNFGFDSPSVGANARARLQDALRYIASVINQPGTLDVVVNPSTNTGGGILASAGTFYTTSAGFQKGLTLQRLSTGVKPFASNEEIVCTVDFNNNWNFTSSPPLSNQIDFQSVLTHEFTHGLGFASLSQINGSSAIAAGVYANFDSFMRRRTGNKVLFSGSPPTFKGTVSDLASDDLMFGGTNANTLYAQPTPPGLFSPLSFTDGSSLSHWDTGNIVGGAVMEHAIGNGDNKREYAPVDIGGLIDIGYTNAVDPGSSPANLTVSPNSTINFGNISLNVGVNQVFTLQNNGGTSLSGSASSNNGFFSVISGSPYTIAAGASTTVTVRFTPLALGATAGTVTFTGDPDGSIGVNLSGTGVTPLPGDLTLSPNPVNFGTVTVGTNVTRTVTVQNTGGTSINATATTGVPFSVVSPVGVFAVAPGASVTVTLRFTPAVAGAASNNLTVTGDPDGNKTVALNGTGVAIPGNLDTDPDITPGFDMGIVPTDNFSTIDFTLTNSGGLPVTGTATTSGPPFSITAGAAYTLAPGASTTVTLRFTPTDTVDFTGTLTLTGDPDGAITVDIIGTGAKAGNAACAAVKGQRNTWSAADALVVALCGAGLVLSARRAARVRS